MTSAPVGLKGSGGCEGCCKIVLTFVVLLRELWLLKDCCVVEGVMVVVLLRE